LKSVKHTGLVSYSHWSELLVFIIPTDDDTDSVQSIPAVTTKVNKRSLSSTRPSAVGSAKNNVKSAAGRFRG